MELRHLRYFASLAEHLNFTRAAEAVHVAQSTLSHQIKVLEDELGHSLFDRRGRHIMLSEKGALFLPHVLRVLAETENSLRAVSGAKLALSGEVYLGAISTVPFDLLSRTVAELIRRNAGIRVFLLELSGEAIEERIRAGTLDIGVVYKPGSLSGLWYESAYEDEFVLIVGPDHPLASRRQIRLGELHGQRLGILSSVESRKLILDYLQTVGAEPEIVAEINKVPPLLGLVTTGPDIATIAPRRSAELMPGLILVQLAHPTPFLELGLIWSRERALSLAAIELSHLLRKAMAG